MWRVTELFDGSFRVEEDSAGCGCGCVAFLVTGGFFIWLIIKLYDVILNWQEYSGFNKFIAGIYYFIIGIPIKFILSPINYFPDNLTQYHNLNMILMILNIILFAVLIIIALIFITRYVSDNLSIFNSGSHFLLLVYLSPVTIWVITKLVQFIISWLFK